jgi:hypothetical protein
MQLKDFWSWAGSGTIVVSHIRRKGSHPAAPATTGSHKKELGFVWTAETSLKQNKI